VGVFVFSKNKKENLLMQKQSQIQSSTQLEVVMFDGKPEPLQMPSYAVLLAERSILCST